MTLQFEHKQDHEICYNFFIHYNHSKHHLHHEIIAQAKLQIQPNSSGIENG